MISGLQIEKLTELSVGDAFERLKRKSVQLKTEPIAVRRKRLKKLLKWVMSNRERIKNAVFQDLHKPHTEADISEVYPVAGEIRHALRHLKRWTRPASVRTPINYLGTRSEVRYEPRGVCLIISPWNFPFNLCVGPLVSCLAAGNTALLKPSEETPATSQLIAEMTAEVFKDEVVTICGGKEVAGELLMLPFDHIFFTGSTAVGKIVMKAAAANLTSITLELGGKSPAIIHSSARIKEAARRIAFGKFLNNGQTCIAPDYLLVHEQVRDKLIAALKEQIIKLFGDNDKIHEGSTSYGRIINAGHFDRLKRLMENATESGARVEFSGSINEEKKFIHPIILTEVPGNALIMEEEIFGPILPILTFKDTAEVLELINTKPKPLALYVFTTNEGFRESIISQTSAGSVCVNDCVLQFTHPNLPFGGVNHSGFGKSHGYSGFLTFSNEKPVLKQKRGFALAYLFHPPFSDKMKKVLEPILRWF